jgi:molybdenum cofactor cytidylyltransferase
MNKIAVLLLAAGSSSRMGQPKQLLAWGNTTLIEHQIRTLIKTGNPVNVVLGFNSNHSSHY